MSNQMQQKNQQRRKLLFEYGLEKQLPGSNQSTISRQGHRDSIHSQASITPKEVDEAQKQSI
jgi:hypothetical protein